VETDLQPRVPSEQPSGSAGSILRKLRNYLVAGALVSVPVYATLWVFHRFFLSVEGVLRLIPRGLVVGGVEIRHLLTSIPGLGAILTLACVVLVGFLTTNLLGKRVVSLYETVIQRVPVLRTVYQGVKQLLQAVFSNKGASSFSDVVYVEWPRKRVWSIGFLTGPAFPDVSAKVGRECVSVFVPTTPNPTTGFYLILPRKDVIRAALSVEQAFKLIMSGGLVHPDAEAEGPRVERAKDASK
jgi:uncharacterized membrane protein